MPKEKTILVRKSMELLPFLLSLPEGMSRKDAKNLLRFKTVAVPGVPAPRHDTKLRAGTEIRIALGKHTPAGTVLPSGVEIVFEDEALIVINKPAGLLTIATESEKSRTAYHHVTSYVQERSPKGDARIFIVHRLDRDTSGLLIFARTEEVKYAFQRAWKSVTKKYHAVVQGTLTPPSGTLRSALVESDSLKVHSTRPEYEDAKPAVTHYKTIRSGSEASLVELMLDTGRKNQIRVQLAEAGHPILGDEKYGATSDPARRLALHAVELHMRHPITGEALDFTSPLPEKLRGLLGKREPLSRDKKEGASRETREPAVRDRKEPGRGIGASPMHETGERLLHGTGESLRPETGGSMLRETGGNSIRGIGGSLCREIGESPPREIGGDLRRAIEENRPHAIGAKQQIRETGASPRPATGESLPHVTGGSLHRAIGESRPRESKSRRVAFGGANRRRRLPIGKPRSLGESLAVMKEDGEAGPARFPLRHFPSAADSWQIIPLAERPAAISTLSSWFHEEWSAYDGRSREEIAAQLGQNLHRDRLPITFLAVRETELLGTVSLDASDLPSHDHLTPWLASLYVIPAARGLGIGAALVDHLLAFARAQGLPRLYLSTPGSTVLYEKLGWRLLERATCAGRPIRIMGRVSASS